MVANKSKRDKRERPTSKKYKFYTIDGDNLKRAKSCPRCGPGIFLADAGNRLYCGKCHWTEFQMKSAAAEKDKADKTKDSKKTEEAYEEEEDEE